MVLGPDHGDHHPRPGAHLSQNQALGEGGEGAIRQTLTRTELTLRYIAFAGIAIGTNLAAQAVVFTVYSGPLKLALAIAVGTVVGLVVKFELDRRLIFYAPQQNAAATGVTFLFYASTGLFTTAIFWGTETLAYLVTHGTAGSQYVGGFIGLTIGYFVKYQLDKRYVFRG